MSEQGFINVLKSGFMFCLATETESTLDKAFRNAVLEKQKGYLLLNEVSFTLWGKIQHLVMSANKSSSNK